MATGKRCQEKRTGLFLKWQESEDIEGKRQGYEIPKEDFILSEPSGCGSNQGVAIPALSDQWMLAFNQHLTQVFGYP